MIDHCRNRYEIIFKSNVIFVGAKVGHNRTIRGLLTTMHPSKGAFTRNIIRQSIGKFKSRANSWSLKV